MERKRHIIHTGGTLHKELWIKLLDKQGEDLFLISMFLF
jgi:hypothetical protein